MPEKSAPGYISIVLIVLLGIFALFAYPYTFPKPTVTPEKCIAGDLPGDISLPLPPIADMDDPNLGAGGGPDSGGPLRPFKQIRKNVWMRRSIIDDSRAGGPAFGGPFQHTQEYQRSEDGKFMIFYPAKVGEKDFYRPFTTTRYDTNGTEGKVNQFRFRQEGIVFFIHINPEDGSLITDKNGNNYLTDFYQAEERLNDPTNDYKTEELFICSEQDNPKTGDSETVSVAIPSPQGVSNYNQQLQLEWFLFQKNYGTVAAHCKPAIYLYPKEKTLVNVKVKTKGFLTLTIPQYDAVKGWAVIASPDGQLSSINNDQLTINNYPYLYYESKVPDELIQKPAKGWVVKYEELANLYQTVLPKLSLNPRQTSDFMEYWKKALPPSPYYFVGVMDQQNINAIEPLEITPKPDFINRVRIYFERLENPVSVETPNLTVNDQQSTVNDSFRVTEWGGMIKNDKDHPFTCSQ